jgi:hypothetical protein
MELFFFGFWDVPVSNYWPFYIVLGLAGFGLCLLHRYLIALALPVIAWCAFKDFASFFASNVGPDRTYIALVGVSVIAAVLLSFLGAYLNFQRAANRPNSLP